MLRQFRARQLYERCSLAARVLCACTAVLLSGGSMPALGVVFSEDPALHQVKPGQVSYGLDLDGVAMVSFATPWGNEDDGPIAFCSAVMISDRHLLTAAHCFDTNEDGNVDEWFIDYPPAAAFHLAGETSLFPFTVDQITFSSRWPEDYMDLAVIEFASAMPATIPHYRVHAGRREVGEQIVIAGYGAVGVGRTGEQLSHPANFRVMHAGLNRVEDAFEDRGVEFLVYDFDNGLSTQNALEQVGVVSDLGFGVDEAVSADGDSGGPVFLNGAVAAITSLGNRLDAADVTDAIDSSWGEFAFDVRLSNHVDFLRQVTDQEVRFAELLGDFNDNGQLDASDLDLLTAAARTPAPARSFDVNDDGAVTAEDRKDWIEKLASTSLGDSDLDGQFTSRDLVLVFQAGEYDDAVPENSRWSTGDWDGDAEFTSADLTAALAAGGYERGPHAAGNAVPEPTSIGILILVAGTAGFAVRRRHAHRVAPRHDS